MKFRTTQKSIRSSYRHIICIGYADAQHLFSDLSPVAYTAGAYGWNADVYDLGDIALVTGYRPFGDLKPRLAMTESYDRAAREIIKSALPAEAVRKSLAELRASFVSSVKIAAGLATL